MKKLIQEGDCKIIPIKRKTIEITLLDEEIEEAEFVCLALSKSYVQFFVDKIKEELEVLSK